MLLLASTWQESRGVLRLKGAATATYVALLDRRGDFLFGVGDMDIHQHLDVDWVNTPPLPFPSSDWWSQV